MRCLAADYVGKAIQVDDSPKAANGPAIKDDPREAAKEPSIKKEIVSAFSRSLSSTDVTINLVDSPEKTVSNAWGFLSYQTHSGRPSGTGS